MSSSLLLYLCDKQQVVQEVDKTIYDLPKKVQDLLLILHGVPDCEGYAMFEKGIFLNIFYFLCFVEDVSQDMVEKQMMKEIDPDLEGGGDFRVSDYREYHWRVV